MYVQNDGELRNFVPALINNAWTESFSFRQIFAQAINLRLFLIVLTTSLDLIYLDNLERGLLQSAFHPAFLVINTRDAAVIPVMRERAVLNFTTCLSDSIDAKGRGPERSLHRRIEGGRRQAVCLENLCEVARNLPVAARWPESL